MTGIASGTSRRAGVSALALLIASAASAAPTETTLHSFAGGKDGAVPVAGLVADSAGNLYGATSSGGPAGMGVVFELMPPAAGKTAWTEQVLHRFGGKDGNTPLAGLILDKTGALYGTTSAGGTGSCMISGSPSGCGNVFKLTPPAAGKTVWTETVLYSLKGGKDGISPEGTLLMDQTGALYGTTYSGGGDTACETLSSVPGCGTVFKLTPPAAGKTVWTEAVLHRFAIKDGANAQGRLIADAGGNLYGTTFAGGASKMGVVFELVAPPAGKTAWAEKTLYSFTGGKDGGGPTVGLTADGAGNLYGTTRFSGNDYSYCNHGNCGVVFKLSPAGKGTWSQSVLYTFTGSKDGGFPDGEVLLDRTGAIYGAAEWGGTGYSICPWGCGTLYKLSPPGAGGGASSETVLYTFTGHKDGAGPIGALIADGQGNLYGMASYGTAFMLAGSGFSP